jgi:hypothetical protein
MLALANDHGDNSFRLIDSKHTNGDRTGLLLVERAFLNHPKERGGCHSQG